MKLILIIVCSAAMALTDLAPPNSAIASPLYAMHPVTPTLLHQVGHRGGFYGGRAYYRPGLYRGGYYGRGLYGRGLYGRRLYGGYGGYYGGYGGYGGYYGDYWGAGSALIAGALLGAALAQAWEPAYQPVYCHPSRLSPRAYYRPHPVYEYTIPHAQVRASSARLAEAQSHGTRLLGRGPNDRSLKPAEKPERGDRRAGRGGDRARRPRRTLGGSQSLLKLRPFGMSRTTQTSPQAKVALGGLQPIAAHHFSGLDQDLFPLR